MSPDPPVPDLAVSEDSQHGYGYRLQSGFNRLPGMVLLPAKERKSSCDQELGTPVGKSLDGQRNSIKGSGTVTKTCHGPASFLPG